eukprot:TRINITY_DN920_c0_g1_i1.p1 TRINITY_DN920_c0_g1~~TRINITY_DN920_c0_g1_i1.p1  ORF type:complete len:634 (-),score=52.47 TRINITY_DN920_c0_g1_i1:7-1908(-)
MALSDEEVEVRPVQRRRVRKVIAVEESADGTIEAAVTHESIRRRVQRAVFEQSDGEAENVERISRIVVEESPTPAALTVVSDPYAAGHPAPLFDTLAFRKPESREVSVQTGDLEFVHQSVHEVAVNTTYEESTGPLVPSIGQQSGDTISLPQPDSIPETRSAGTDLTMATTKADEAGAIGHGELVSPPLPLLDQCEFPCLPPSPAFSDYTNQCEKTCLPPSQCNSDRNSPSSSGTSPALTLVRTTPEMRNTSTDLERPEPKSAWPVQDESTRDTHVSFEFPAATLARLTDTIQIPRGLEADPELVLFYQRQALRAIEQRQVRARQIEKQLRAKAEAEARAREAERARAEQKRKERENRHQLLQQREEYRLQRKAQEQRRERILRAPQNLPLSVIARERQFICDSRLNRKEPAPEPRPPAQRLVLGRRPNNLVQLPTEKRVTPIEALRMRRGSSAKGSRPSTAGSEHSRSAPSSRPTSAESRNHSHSSSRAQSRSKSRSSDNSSRHGSRSSRSSRSRTSNSSSGSRSTARSSRSSDKSTGTRRTGPSTASSSETPRESPRRNSASSANSSDSRTTSPGFGVAGKEPDNEPDAPAPISLVPVHVPAPPKKRALQKRESFSPRSVISGQAPRGRRS